LFTSYIKHAELDNTEKLSTLTPETIEIIRDAEKAVQLEIKLISSALYTIEFIFSSVNVFHIQGKLAVIDALKHLAAKRRVRIRILTPKGENIEDMIEGLKKEIDDFNVHYFTYNSDIRTKTLIVDRKESLVMEIKEQGVDDEVSKEEGQQKQRIVSFNKIIGLSTYSNSTSTVLSYAAVFDTLWNETELHKQVRESNKRLEISNEQLGSTNRQLVLANEQLKVHDKMQKEFINIASHEMRTPTQAIVGYSELLDMEPERSKEYVGPILRNAERLQRLTGDILDVARMESRTLKLNIEQFNLKDVISSNIQDYRNQIQKQGKKEDIKLVYDDNEPKDNIFINADKARVSQVISNLLNNAIKFTKEGVISITAAEKKGDDDNNDNDDEVILLQVKDTGQGIDSGIFPRLFTKFVSKSFEGTGLGLYICKSIVEAHGGKIWAENNSKDRGATFSLSLPILTKDTNR
jgi:two-component system, OmpR family, sensor histidine kinase VicK